MAIMQLTNKTVVSTVEITDAELLDLVQQADPLTQLFVLGRMARAITPEVAAKLANLTGPKPIEDLCLEIATFNDVMLTAANDVARATQSADGI